MIDFTEVYDSSVPSSPNNNEKREPNYFQNSAEDICPIGWSLGIGKDEFTAEDIFDSVKFLNNSLVSLGFRGDLVFGTTSPIDVVAILQCMHMLVKQKAVELQIRQDLETRNSRLESDVLRLQKDKNSLDAALSSKERDFAALESSILVKESLSRKDKNKLRSEKEELEKRNVKLQNLDSQYKAALRKKETDYVRLQKRLQSLMAHTHSEAIKLKRGVESSSVASSAVFIKSQDREAEPLTRAVVEAYTKKQAVLEGENQHMRTSLEKLQHDLHTLRHQRAELFSLTAEGVTERTDTVQCGVTSHDRRASEQDCECDTPRIEEILPAQFQLPFELARGTIEGGLRTQIQAQKDEIHVLLGQLTDRMASFNSSEQLSAPGSEQLLEDSCQSGKPSSILEVALKEAMVVVAKQEQLLQLSLYFDCDQSTASSLNVSMCRNVECIEGSDSSMDCEEVPSSSSAQVSRGNFSTQTENLRTAASVASFQSPVASRQVDGTSDNGFSIDMPSPLSSPFSPPPATPGTAALLRTRIGANVKVISQDSESS